MMESLLLRALESTLRYWLKTFSRDQFKLRGRSIHLHNLDVDGAALHASVGLPPSLQVTEARANRLELKIPSLSNVNREPIVVEIDKLEVIIAEQLLSDLGYIPGTISNYSGENYSYGYSDKLLLSTRKVWFVCLKVNSVQLADGMTVHVETVHMLLETKAGKKGEGGATWGSIVSITMRNLNLFTTNEYWQVVPLNQAREFSNNKRAIYVFKKLEWDSLSIYLLPHTEMYKSGQWTEPPSMDGSEWASNGGQMSWHGESFLENVSGSAHITIKRTEQNNPLGLEVQLHVPEMLCPSLSELGLRALLRFMTGIYIAMNRNDAKVRGTQPGDVSRTSLGVTVDHIFLCIKDTEIQLELLMQSLQYVRASISDVDSTQTMTQFVLLYFFMRDSFSKPSSTLIQPNMQTSGPTTMPPIPSFANEKLWPRLHPLESEWVPRSESVPMLCLYSSQTTPSPAAPTLASQTVVQCQPLKINLQEEICLQIACFLADGVSVDQGVVLPDTSLHAMYFSLKEVDLMVPMKKKNKALHIETGKVASFSGATLHVEGVMMAQSPFVNFRSLNLEKDSACHRMWKDQPVDSSQLRWMMRANQVCIALEAGSSDDDSQQSMSMTEAKWDGGLWQCVQMFDLNIEVAMATADGRPLMIKPPPGGTLRFGISCRRCVSNVSWGQFLFVLELYTYLCKVIESFGEKLGTSFMGFHGQGSAVQLIEMVPGNSAAILTMSTMELKIFNSMPGDQAGHSAPLVQILSWDFNLHVAHETLAGALKVTSKVLWQDVQVDLSLPAPAMSSQTNPVTYGTKKTHAISSNDFSSSVNSEVVGARPERKEGSASQQLSQDMCTVIWIGEERGSMVSAQREVAQREAYSAHPPFLDITMEDVIPHKEQVGTHRLKVVAKVSGVRMGGGMCYIEALLHGLNVLKPNGTPGDDVKKMIRILADSPFMQCFQTSTDAVRGDMPTSSTEEQSWEMGIPDTIDIDIQLLDWLFPLKETMESPQQEYSALGEDRCWYITFGCMQIMAQGSKVLTKKDNQIHTIPVQNVTMKIGGFQALKSPFLASSKTYNLDSVEVGAKTDVAQNTFGDTEFRGMGTSKDPVHQMGDEQTMTSHKPSTIPSITDRNGFDVEVSLVEQEDDLDPSIWMGRWIAESFRVAVRDPVEISATRQELERVVELFKSEFQAARQIAAGLLKLLELPLSTSQPNLEQFSDAGSSSSSLDKVLSPDKEFQNDNTGLSKETRPSATLLSSQVLTKRDKDIAALEAAIASAQVACSKIGEHMIWVQEDRCASVSSLFCCKTVLTDRAPVSELSALRVQLQSMQTILQSLKNEDH